MWYTYNCYFEIQADINFLKFYVLVNLREIIAAWYNLN